MLTVSSAENLITSKGENDPKACVLRELKEELGISENDIRNLLLRYVTLRRIKGEIRQNYYFFAELDNEAGDHIVSTEGISRWFTLSELSALEMPYTAKFVIEHYLKIGHKTNEMYVGVADGKRVDFTKLPEYYKNRCSSEHILDVVRLYSSKETGFQLIVICQKAVYNGNR